MIGCAGENKTLNIMYQCGKRRKQMLMMQRRVEIAVRLVHGGFLRKSYVGICMFSTIEVVIGIFCAAISESNKTEGCIARKVVA